MTQAGGMQIKHNDINSVISNRTGRDNVIRSRRSQGKERKRFVYSGKLALGFGFTEKKTTNKLLDREEILYISSLFPLNMFSKKKC